MEPWNKRFLQAVFLPGGAILLGAFLLLNPGLVNPSVYGVRFFYYAVFIAALLLSWRFHTTRIFLSAVVLLLAHRALEFFSQGHVVASGPGRVAFEAIALLLPLNFILLTFFPERGYPGRSLSWFLILLFFESVFVAAIARPEQPAPAFLHAAPLTSIHSRLPQPALLLFVIALGYLLYRLLRFQKPTIIGMFWSLIATWLALNNSGIGKTGSAYFGVAALILAGSIVENSYALAYRDELTGLHSRRAFNDALARLKPPYAVAAVDIDHFKSINDTYGHDIGDQVLRMVASKLARVGGSGDPFRVGGEEFTILFPGKTGREVVDILELLRLNIESSSFRVRSGEERRKVQRSPERRTAGKKRETPHLTTSSSVSLSVTVSIGIGESQPKLSSDEIIHQADKALYRAKRGGRNRIETGVPEKKVLGFRRKKPKDSGA
ncbi:MAG TPA: GGDEF domain-containing protein [Terriglobales bacterium]|jgi:diguanylate cyclase (GGDEF)-like protein|nr:GGDEF domain-containing protein [Terriglobales bacterium]